MTELLAPTIPQHSDQAIKNQPLQTLNTYHLTGRCSCSYTTYTLSSPPLIVHACHCTYCQRETGTSFALNAIYEPSRVLITLSTGLSGSAAEQKLLRVAIPTASSEQGQTMVRCPSCYTILWSTYALGGPLKIVRVGTIDGTIDVEGRYLANGGLRPDAHIFAGEKRHRWLGLQGERVYEGYGPREAYWPKESLERLEGFTRENEDVTAFSA